MPSNELENRVIALEQKVAELEKRLDPQSANGRHPNPNGAWWQEDAGRFVDDPVFEEIVRLGREYRESLKPARVTKKKKATSAKKNAHS